VNKQSASKNSISFFLATFWNFGNRLTIQNPNKKKLRQGFIAKNTQLILQNI